MLIVSRRRRAHAGWLRAVPLLALTATLCACKTQAPYASVPLAAPAAWSVAATTDAAPAIAQWWTRLNDPAIDALAEAVLAGNPTLQQALARIDEADANLRLAAAQRLPALQANLGGSRARTADGGQPAYATGGTLGLALSWEVDLFGRVRGAVDSARYRLNARHADADAASLSLAARVADTVLAARGCRFAQAVLSDDVASRALTLKLTGQQLTAGALAAVDEARARASLANARTLLASREQQCSGHINALAALSGRGADAIDALLDGPLRRPPSATPSIPAILPRYAQWLMPVAPDYGLALPASVLARHPAVRAADAELAAAWSDIGVMRAERLPRLDLGAALSGQWLRAAGSDGGTRSNGVWSLAPNLTLPLFDNGRGAAGVAASQARYRQAEASLQTAVRDAARDVENALAARRSAEVRLATTRAAVDAAQTVFDTTDAMWRAGAASLFVLEDARRQLAAAQNDAISAAQDGSQAWVALVLACGHFPSNDESNNNETL